MLTHDEAELYDRQIRLWGVNAQSRIRQSKVLMLGFNGIASEVAKILVLAGIDTLTIVDDQPLQEADLSSNLFCRPSSGGDQHKYRTHDVTSKLKTLNPLVNVNVDNSPILSRQPENFTGFDLVTLHSFLTTEETSTINDICRANRIKFYIVLDYGLFGFMFNDLGVNFKFSYEEFSDVAKNGNGQQTGQEKDPISFVDDMDDISQDSDEEDNRPKKKRRLHSPKRESASKVEDEKVTKIGQLSYANFKDMISLKNYTSTKKSSPVLIISVALYKFYTLYRHLPRQKDDQAKAQDLSELNKIIHSLKESLNLNDAIFKKLDADWSEYIYGSLSPVCAVVGGVAGQDMIRALSGKDLPLINTFSFDGISMNGIVEKIGISDNEINNTAPVVRDVLQIDSDDE